MADDQDYRLPRTVVPQRYDLRLAPNLAASTFTGTAVIQVQITDTVDEIVLNAAELEVSDVHLVGADGSRRAEVSLDPRTERATLRLDRPAEPGEWALHLAFTGTLNDQLAGFYRSTFRDANDVERVIATTQFESTDARRAFPCWDEPDFKAVFGVTLVVEKGLTAISNGPAIAEAVEPDAKVAVTFADTIALSTYLVAFVVGPLQVTDPVDVDGIPLRVVSVPGRERLTGWALECGAHALRFFQSYFGIPYPTDKLDLIALPDFAFGAMENLGAVTFRETALLVDPESASRLDRERVADVVAHEIAHMWFGDLVTMKWWNGIWLNEAFATFMELHAVDDFRPDWHRFVSFAVGRGSAMTTDGMASTRPVEFPVVAPEEAEGMFDVLTYQKGASVVRMLEQYVGGDEFRTGIRAYMAKHAYGNTETTDLWDAIEGATSQPVRSMMDSWIFQGGYPVVSVDLAIDRRSVALRQERFRYIRSPAERHLPAQGAAQAQAMVWDVPVLWRSNQGEGRMILDGPDGAITFDAPVEWVVVNAGGSGFYRTRYGIASLPPTAELDPLERFNLVNDTWAMALSGRAALADYVELVATMGEEVDPTVWTTIATSLALVDRLMPPGDRPRLQSFVQTLASPAFAKLGWSPTKNEPEKTGELRGVLVELLGTTGADAAVRAQAADLHAQYLSDPASIPADLAAPVLAITAATGGEAEYTDVIDRFRRPANPQEEVRYLYALAGFRHDALVHRTLDLANSGEVRTQNAPFLVSNLLTNRVGGPQAWQWLKDHWDQVTEKWPDNSHARVLGTVPALAAFDLADDVRAFVTAHPVKAGGKTVEQALESLDVNTAFKAREARTAADAFPPA